MKFLRFTIAAALITVSGTAFAGEQALALFVGITDDRGDNAFSMGLDYEYHLSELIGVGGLLDVAGSDVRSFVVGVPVFFHPVGGLLLLAAPGVEHQNDGSNEFLIRIGVGWEFEAGERFTIIPIANIDFVDGDKVYVYGVDFGYKLGCG